MIWDFSANSPKELATIGTKLLRPLRPTFRDEQWQMSRLLEALSSTSLFQFPLRVRHTGEKGVPDYQVESDGRQIAIELAKVTLQDVEHARGLQRRGINRTLGISSLYLKQSQPRTAKETLI